MIGYIAGALTTIAFAPQLIKVLTTKSTKDVYLLMLLCSTSYMVLWLFYGIPVDDPAIIAANSFSVILAVSLRGLKLNYEYINLVDNFCKKIRGSKNKNAFLWK
jgi:MtN3 and saliva related transmembrane protein